MLTLDATTLRALRSATGVIFRNNLGADTLELLHKGNGTEATITLAVDDGSESFQTFRSAFAFIQSAGFHDHWRTVVSCLRAGDSIAFAWRPDYHSNDYARMVGLHVDVIGLVVHRPTRDGRSKRLYFDIEQSVTPDNSARMIAGHIVSVNSYGTPCVMTQTWDELQRAAQSAERARLVNTLSA